MLWMGGEFLPPFNEGTLTDQRAGRAGHQPAGERPAGPAARERCCCEVPEVMSVSRRTGRAEMDEHAEDVNSSEIDVRLLDPRAAQAGLVFAVLRAIPGLHGLGVERVGRPREEVLADIRDRVDELPGVKVNIGQPISHRLDHIMSGIRAQIAVKLFGPDLRELRDRGPGRSDADEPRCPASSICRSSRRWKSRRSA